MTPSPARAASDAIVGGTVEPGKRGLVFDQGVRFRWIRRGAQVLFWLERIAL